MLKSHQLRHSAPTPTPPDFPRGAADVALAFCSQRSFLLIRCKRSCMRQCGPCHWRATRPQALRQICYVTTVSARFNPRTLFIPPDSHFSTQRVGAANRLWVEDRNQTEHSVLLHQHFFSLAKDGKNKQTFVTRFHSSESVFCRQASLECGSRMSLRAWGLLSSSSLKLANYPAVIEISRRREEKNEKKKEEENKDA